DHIVFTTDGLAFAPHPVVTDTDRDKYVVKQIIDFYNRQPVELSRYLEAAWRFRYRHALNMSNATLEQVAAEFAISPRYLATIWSLLNKSPVEVGPVASVHAHWNALPSPSQVMFDADELQRGCVRIATHISQL